MLVAGAAIVTIGLGAAYARFAVPWVESLLDAATVEQDAGGIERWRVQPIYRELAERLFGRAALLAWTLPLFVLAVWRLRASGDAVAKALTAAYASLLGYLAIELLAAPFLITRLDLYDFFVVLDVDHRLPASEKWIPTNADGLRGVRERGDYSAGDTNVLFAGDSFTFGFRVEAHQAFPARFEEIVSARRPDLRVRAVNLGWTSASPSLALRLLEDVGDAYHPDLVVYGVDMTDFHDDIKYQNMLARRGIYRTYDKIPITLHLLERWWPDAFGALYAWSNDNLPRERFFHSEQPLDLSRAAMEPTLESLRQIDGWARARGVAFAVVVLPRTYQLSAAESPQNREAGSYSVLGPYSLEPLRYLEEAAERVEFPIFSLLPAFRETSVFPTSFADDPHWTPAGHEVAAEALVALLAPLLEDAAAAAPSDAEASPAREPAAPAAWR